MSHNLTVKIGCCVRCSCTNLLALIGCRNMLKPSKLCTVAHCVANVDRQLQLPSQTRLCRVAERNSTHRMDSVSVEAGVAAARRPRTTTHSLTCRSVTIVASPSRRALSVRATIGLAQLHNEGKVCLICLSKGFCAATALQTRNQQQQKTLLRFASLACLWVRMSSGAAAENVTSQQFQAIVCICSP